MGRMSNMIEVLLVSLNPLAAAWSRAWCEYALSLPSTELYVKTIYFGAHVDGQMFAALYPGGGGFELALAVPEDLPGSDLIDASHLTWPTMPLALVGRYDKENSPEWHRARELTAAAHLRVVAGSHDVRRPAEYFQQKKETRRRDK